MTNIPQLGQLEPVDLRKQWPDEAADFTRWLAADGLRLLEDVLGLDLEVESTETRAGQYRLDILCRDADDRWVVIENQIEDTNHKHLGQLLTYASALQASSIVWVARRFSEEHRAALDWLNLVTSDEVNFFGLEIELWRIDGSLAAPKFNIVSKPNNWRRVVKENAKSDTELTDIRQLQLEYWNALRAYLQTNRSILKARRPLPRTTYLFAIGRSKVRLEAFINTRDKRLGVQVSFRGHARSLFDSLQARAATIEAELGFQVIWNSTLKNPQIKIRNEQLDPNVREQWPDQHRWLKSTLETFYQVLNPKLVQLIAGDFEARHVENEPDEDESL